MAVKKIHSARAAGDGTICHYRLAGMMRVSHLEDNVAAAEINLSPAEVGLPGQERGLTRRLAL